MPGRAAVSCQSPASLRTGRCSQHTVLLHLMDISLLVFVLFSLILIQNPLATQHHSITFCFLNTEKQEVIQRANFLLANHLFSNQLSTIPLSYMQLSLHISRLFPSFSAHMWEKDDFMRDNIL